MISRGNSSSVVATAAYRAGEKLRSEAPDFEPSAVAYAAHHSGLRVDAGDLVSSAPADDIPADEKSTPTQGPGRLNLLRDQQGIAALVARIRARSEGRGR